MKDHLFGLISMALLIAASPAILSRAETPPILKAENSTLEIRVDPLSRNQVKKRFVSGLHENYLAVKVSLIPKTSSPIEVNRTDFWLQEGNGEVMKPEVPSLLAEKLYQSQNSRKDVSIEPSTEIGYRSGSDPYSRDPRWSGDPRRGRKGVYYGVGVGVGLGTRRLTPEDREVIELELSERSLPEGPISQPVSGHLYFASGLERGESVTFVYSNGQDAPLTLQFELP